MEMMLGYYCILCLLVVQCYGRLKGNDVKNFALKFNKIDFANENSVEYTTDQVLEPFPCQMVKTQYGCCWDRKTIATGPNGQGCPKCKDHRHMKCKNWKPFCNDKLVSAMCPSTCGNCPSKKTCQDDVLWEKFCPIYNRLGFCKQSSIARHCKQTCAKCT